MLGFIIFIGRINYKYYKDLFMSKYYSINKFSKILGVLAQTLRNWDKKGKLHPHPYALGNKGNTPDRSS